MSDGRSIGDSIDEVVEALGKDQLAYEDVCLILDTAQKALERLEDNHE